jgi:hypothetical protein
MVALLRLGCEFGYAKLETAVLQAMELGCTDVAANVIVSRLIVHVVP